MNEKHLIWMVPLLFFLGFVIGYVSGMKVPALIEFGINNQTLTALDKYYDLENNKTCDINNIADKILEDCGDTYLTKKIPNEGEWQIFKKDCKLDGYCNYIYVPLSECYKG